MINVISRSQTELTSRIFIFVAESRGLVELSYGTGRSGGNSLLIFQSDLSIKLQQLYPLLIDKV